MDTNSLQSDAPTEAKGQGLPTLHGSLVPVQFDRPTTGNVHTDQQIEWAVDSALTAIKQKLCAEIVNRLKREMQIYERFPAPKPGTILNRGTAVDKVCQCGRVVTFQISKLHPEN